MRIAPVELERREVWGAAQPDVVMVAVRTEQVSGRGEDGPPTVLYHSGSGRGLIGVYDGAGGAGGGTAGTLADGRQVSGAFVASRQVHFALEDWFRANALRRPPAAGGDDLVNWLRSSLEPLRQRRRRKIKGTMVRELPTTLAAIEYSPNGERIDVAARWAGDSRCYRLVPEHGLQRLSRDDIASGDDDDPSGGGDQPMTNMVCADRDFWINTMPLTSARLPSVLVCATDGFHAYVETPAHFELVLLETLLEAEDARGWAAALAERVASYTKDDASLALVALGFTDLAAAKDAFLERYRWLRQCVEPLEAVDPADRQRRAEARRRLWESYRPVHEYFVSRRPEEPR
jgi:hypothetical protein